MSETNDRRQISNCLVAFLLSAAVIGLVLVPVVFVQPGFQQLHQPLEQFLVGSLYTSLCVLGIIAVFFPEKCRGFFQKTQRPFPQTELPPNKVGIKGHHPDCQGFSGNRIMVRGRTFCAACSGLFVGAIVVLVGTGFQFFAGVNVVEGNVWVVVFGEISVLLGLAQVKLSGFVKAVTNAVFVIGSFILLGAVDVLGKNVFLDFYVLGLIGFLLWFRILLSQWNNTRVCQGCRSCFQ